MPTGLNTGSDRDNYDKVERKIKMEDALEKLLNGELEEPTDDDTDENVAAESDTDEESPAAGTEEPADDQGTTDITTLQAQLEAIQREKDGLLKGIQEERKKRQEFKGRLDQLTSTVNAILEQRTKGAADLTGEQKKQIKGITVEFDEDGNAYLPSEKLAAILTPYQRKIMELEERSTATAQQTQQQAEANRVLQQILSEDASYPTAFNSYQKAREWANQKVIEFQMENELRGPMTGEQALDYVFNPELETEFNTLFPGADLEAVVGNSKRAFRKALKSLAPATQTDETPIVQTKKPAANSQFKKVLNKPSGLGATKNAKGGDLGVTDRLAELGSQDIMNLSDKEIRALEQALLAEEKTGGIRF